MTARFPMSPCQAGKPQRAAEKAYRPLSTLDSPWLACPGLDPGKMGSISETLRLLQRQELDATVKLWRGAPGKASICLPQAFALAVIIHSPSRPLPHGLTMGSIPNPFRLLQRRELDATVKPWRVAIPSTFMLFPQVSQAIQAPAPQSRRAPSLPAAIAYAVSLTFRRGLS